MSASHLVSATMTTVGELTCLQRRSGVSERAYVGRNEEVGLTSCDPLLGSLEVLNDDDEPGRREGKR